jgi:hypothetical protein
LKIPLIIICYLIGNSGAFAQIPEFTANSTKEDSATNPLIDSFAKHYDFVLAYSELSYHNSGKQKYQIVAGNNHQWSMWYYTDYFIMGTKKPGEAVIKIDTVKQGTFYKGKTKIKKSNSAPLLSMLNDSDFWSLNNDSLNQSKIIPGKIINGDTAFEILSIADGITYRFDILSKNKFRAIESYEPDYFIHFFPEMVSVRKFIACRDGFQKWWNQYFK